MAKKNKADVENIKEKRKPNWLLRITILVILIPCIIVGIVLLTSIDKSGTPVTGKRFNDQLVNKITEEDIANVKAAIEKDKDIENVSVTLKSATLRITLDCRDDISKDDLKETCKVAYDATVKILPIKTYFTNLKDDDGNVVKMYDLEVQAYNTIDEESDVKKLHIVMVKNAPAEGKKTTWASSVKNSEVRKEVEGK